VTSGIHSPQLKPVLLNLLKTIEPIFDATNQRKLIGNRSGEAKTTTINYVIQVQSWYEIPKISSAVMNFKISGAFPPF